MAEKRRGYWAETIGALVLIAALAILAWQLMTAGGLTTIPFNNYTYSAIGLALVGAVGFGVGAYRDLPKG